MMSLLSLCTALALSACAVPADHRSVADTIKQIRQYKTNSDQVS
nr:hypothetical protein [Paenibacillus xylanexedens]